MAIATNFPVYSEAQMEQTITSYIAQGFVLSNRTPTSATLFKKKEFSILWLVIGLILCVFPLIIFLIVYAGQSDQLVQIYLADPATAPAVIPPPAGQISPDGRWRWDGAQWIPVPGIAAPQTGPTPSGATPPGMDEQPGG